MWKLYRAFLKAAPSFICLIITEMYLFSVEGSIEGFHRIILVAADFKGKVWCIFGENNCDLLQCLSVQNFITTCKKIGIFRGAML